MKALDENLATKISDLEMELSTFARHPSYLVIDKEVGPYQITRIWFDDLDGQPTLGVTYEERSVKNGKKINIFRAVRIDTPPCLVDVWRKSIFVLVQKIAAQGSEEENPKYVEIPQTIQTLVQELQESDE